jgi:hypothetical protein
MSDTRRLLEAAAALSRLLNDHGVAHAFHGNVLTAVLANGSHSDVCLTLCTLHETNTDPLIVMDRRRK